MAVSRENKGKILDSYRAALSNANGMIITEYRGISVKNLMTTRRAFREANGRFIVAKVTLLKLALEENGFAVPEVMLKGPVGIAIAYGELSTLTKSVLQRAKEDDKLILKGAIMGKTVFTEEQLEAVSTMPTLEEARASLVGILQTPATQFMGLIGQPAQQFAQILKAFTDKSSEGGAA